MDTVTRLFRDLSFGVVYLRFRADMSKAGLLPALWSDSATTVLLDFGRASICSIRVMGRV